MQERLKINQNSETTSENASVLHCFQIIKNIMEVEKESWKLGMISVTNVLM